MKLSVNGRHSFLPKVLDSVIKIILFLEQRLFSSPDTKFGVSCIISNESAIPVSMDGPIHARICLYKADTDLVSSFCTLSFLFLADGKMDVTFSDEENSFSNPEEDVQEHLLRKFRRIIVLDIAKGVIQEHTEGKPVGPC